MSGEPDYTGIAVAVGRVEEKISNLTNNRENDIAFQQSVRDTLQDHESRITSQEASSTTMKWLFGVSTPFIIFGATLFSSWILK